MAIVLTSLMLVPLLVVSAFVVDVGSWEVRANQLQRAADAAALAGVVWLPDLTTATSVAVDTASRNGVVASSTLSIRVRQTGGGRLEVTITDSSTPQYFSQLVMHAPTITRVATAEYNPPVPIGSPKNHLGMENLLGSSDQEGLFMAVNGYCEAKENGDPYSVRFAGNNVLSYGSLPCPTPEGPGPAGPAEVNSEYRSSGYEYYVDLPAGRSQPVDLLAYSAAWSSTSVHAPDLPGAVTTIYSLRAPDSTAFDDTDNPAYSCSTGLLGASGTATVAPDDASVVNYGSFLGLTDWTLLCRIPTGIDGKFILRVESQANELAADGQNAYGLFTRLGTGGACDARTDATCPRVYARNDMSIAAFRNVSVAQFYLAQIDASHAGETLYINLFDPGEGADYLRVLDPNGNAVNFDWTTNDSFLPVLSGAGTDRIDVSGATTPRPNRASSSTFNERWIRIKVTLPSNYAARYGSNQWWQLEYHVQTTVHDRTTWWIQLLGNPVHLVE